MDNFYSLSSSSSSSSFASRAFKATLIGHWTQLASNGSVRRALAGDTAQHCTVVDTNGSWLLARWKEEE